MNGGAVITNEKKKIQTGRDYPKCNAKLALMDPTYTYSLPKKQMVSAAFDTLSHIMEIYFSVPDEPGRNPEYFSGMPVGKKDVYEHY